MLSWAEPSNPAHKHISNIEHAHNYWHHVHVHRTGWPTLELSCMYVCMYIHGRTDKKQCQMQTGALWQIVFFNLYHPPPPSLSTPMSMSLPFNYKAPGRRKVGWGLGEDLEEESSNGRVLSWQAASHPHSWFNWHDSIFAYLICGKRVSWLLGLVALHTWERLIYSWGKRGGSCFWCSMVTRFLGSSAPGHKRASPKMASNWQRRAKTNRMLLYRAAPYASNEVKCLIISQGKTAKIMHTAIPTKSDLNKLHKNQRQKRLKNVWQLDGDEQDFCFYF